MESGYQRAIAKPLDDASVPDGHQVEIAMIGYSKGGMAAIEHAGSDSRVKDLVIVGSSVGHKSVPSTV